MAGVSRSWQELAGANPIISMFGTHNLLCNFLYRAGICCGTRRFSRTTDSGSSGICYTTLQHAVETVKSGGITSLATAAFAVSRCNILRQPSSRERQLVSQQLLLTPANSCQLLVVSEERERAGSAEGPARVGRERKDLPIGLQPQPQTGSNHGSKPGAQLNRMTAHCCGLGEMTVAPSGTPGQPRVIPTCSLGRATKRTALN